MPNAINIGNKILENKRFKFVPLCTFSSANLAMALSYGSSGSKG